MKRFALPLLIVCHFSVFAQGTRWQSADGGQGKRWELAPDGSRGMRWQFAPDGGRGMRWQFAPDGGIRWTVTGGASHTDHIEMSGRRLSAIITYGVDSMQRLVWHRQLVFPMLRTIPNDTHASLHGSFEDNIIESVTAEGQRLKESPTEFSINGYLSVVSKTNTPVQVKRCIYPSTDKAACVETYELLNTGTQPVSVHIPFVYRKSATAAAKGVYGVYTLASTTFRARDTILPAGASYSFYMVFSGRRAAEEPVYISAAYEFEKRKQLVDELENNLVLHTSNDTLDRMFAFAKVRAAESIFDTKGGLMHGPGGGSYYAAIWANDQAEYVSPFFPFLGNAEAIESARNCYRLFASYMNAAYKPIPSSIVAEGIGTWNGAGDRGDQAMIAYGAARFALAYGDVQEARQLWPLITWCLEYLRRQQTSQGVIASNSDELEGRFPTGKINLSTNVLAYGALTSAGHLAAALGEADVYSARADELRVAIEKYFGGTVQGFKTYRYYEGNTTLRSWICLPLVMGLNERKEETIKALLSKYLWSKNGILTESGSQTFWDRSTLYAFRGLFYAGATDTSLKYLNYYSAMRLLGEHVPYAVEAWPEGDQRHLSAESGLYCRIITEGLFGIEPTGFNAFTLMPRLPNGWDRMSLEHIRAFNRDFSISVSRDGQGEKIIISVTGRAPVVYNWDGMRPLVINL